VRVLVAEDETIIRLDLVEMLGRAGLEVVGEARDGIEAVELARTQEPDLAVLDVKMPRLDGIEAARRILDERPIPIVMLTAYGQAELVGRAVEAGVFGYLVKPFREVDLLPAIQAARARHEELTALRDQADSLAEALVARKSIERAKGLLMEREGLSEQEAFARLRKASQVSGRPLRVVADAVVATLSPPRTS
jgi:two-component system, response regulator PdtaR